MKKILLTLLIAILMFATVGLVSCKSEETPNNDSTNTEQTPTSPTPEQPTPSNPTPEQPENTDIEITGVSFSNKTFTYNGTQYEILVDGTIPNGVSISYQNNKGTNAGTYNATAVLSGSGYITKTLSATLTINKANYDMSSLSWNYQSAFTYDGQEKTVSLTGNYPSGVTLKSYSNNTKTNANTYTATATFNYDSQNYNEPTVNACNWTINKAIMPDFTLGGNKNVEYDTFTHSLFIEGNIPANSSVSYTYNGQLLDGVSEVGEYTVIATVTNPNYFDKTVTEVLKITSTEKLLYSLNHNGTIYFQNNLDDDKLYKSTNTGIEKVNNDSPKFMIANGNNVYYTSSSLFNSSIKQLSNSTASILYSINGEYLTSDGSNIYYAINNLLFDTDENGIYKISLSGSEATPIKICSEKAKYLTYCNGYIYYANASEGNKLYKISTTANNAKGTLAIANFTDKIEEIIIDGNSLYFTASNTIAGVVNVSSAIYKYTVTSSTPIKLTTDNGKYLTKIGNYIYYVNNDLLTSTLFGDGIYKVTSLATSNSSLPGTKVISVTNNGYSSLSSDGTYLYYYKLNNKHFYKYNISTTVETDLMQGFTPVETTLASGFAKIAEYNGEIYFTNPLDFGAVYKYNPTTKLKARVLEESISNVYFNDGYMYYSTYVLTNFALWKMNLSTNETVKISSDRCDNLIFYDSSIYYIKTGSAYNNHIYKMGLDGSNPTKLFDTSLWVSDFYIDNGKLYCAANAGFLGNNDKLYIYDIASNTYTECSFETEAFTVNDGKVYYYDHNDNNIYVYNGSSSTKLVQNVKVNDLIVYNGKLIYSSTSGNVGIYSLDLNTKQSTLISSNNGDGFISYNGNLYFIQTAISYTNDYPTCGGVSTNDAHLYYYNGSNVIKAF